MRSLVLIGCIEPLLTVCMLAQRMASTYPDLQPFVDSCPQNDPYTPIIRRDFKILGQDFLVGNELSRGKDFMGGTLKLEARAELDAAGTIDRGPIS